VQPARAAASPCSHARYPRARAPLFTVSAAVSSGSFRRAYLEWVEEQIEDFKETVSRSDLLRLADDVVEELRVTNGGQYQLTEMLLWEAVDRRIFRLLQLPGYRAWRAAHRSGESGPDRPDPMLPFGVD
jgi:hypothetical protein